jgi:hypothetical protein
MILNIRHLPNFRDIFKNDHYELILFVIFQILVIAFWFKDHVPFQFAESGLYLYSSRYLLTNSHYSYTDFGLGGPNLQIQSSVLAFTIYLLRDIFGLPIYVVQFIIFSSSALSATIGIYFLTLFLAKNEKLKYKKMSGVLASLFYFLNPYAIMVIWNRFQIPFIIFYGYIPLALMFYLKGIAYRSFRYIIFVLIINYFLLPSFAVLTYIITFHLFIVFITLFILISSLFMNYIRLDDFKFFILYFVLFELLWFLTNLWWVLPEFFMLTQVGFDVSFISGSRYLARYFSLSLGSILNAFRIFYEGYFKSRNSLFSFDYFSPIYIAISIMIVIIVFLPLIYPRKMIGEKLNISLFLAFVTMATFFIFLSKGTLSPFGEFYNFLLNFKFFQVYRIPFEKFGIFIVLSYSILFGVSISLLAEIFYEVTKKHFINHLLVIFTFIICILLCVAPGKPILDASVFRNIYYPSNIKAIGYKAVVPDYYFELSRIIVPDPSRYRILFLPIRRYGGQVSYNWSCGYYGLDSPLQIFNGQTISYILYSSYLPQTDNLIIMLEDALMQNKSLASLLLSIFNIKYIIIQYDLSYPLPCKYTPDEIEKKLNKSDLVSFLYKIDKLVVYKVNDEIFFERVYISNTRSLNISNILFYPYKIESKITYRRINPSLYIISIENISSQSFVLVLNELYHPSWILIEANSTSFLDILFNSRKCLVKHFIVNGYANGWFFNNTSLMMSNGKINFVLIFMPQILEDLGFLFSFIIWLCLIASFLLWIETKRMLCKPTAATIKIPFEF